MKFLDYISKVEEDIRKMPKAQALKSDMPFFDSVEDREAFKKLALILGNYDENNEELRKIKESINSTKKLESLGTMAAGMAHEFNNILQPISGFSEIMMTSDNLPEHYYEWLEIINESASRGSGLVEQIMNYSRKDKDAKKDLVDFSLLVEEFYKIISLSKHSNLDVEMDNFIEPGASFVFVNKSEIHQVLINVFNNSVHAVETKSPGRIEILAYEMQMDMNTTTEERSVVVEIRDNGYGIPEENMNKIFEPFYTTKPIGQGTGLGLSIINNIMKGNAGDILVNSSTESGTSFKIILIEQEE